MDMTDVRTVVALGFPIRRWSLQAYRIEPYGDTDVHWLRVKNKMVEETIMLTTPTPVNGVYNVRGVHKVLIHHGMRGANYPKSPRRLDSVLVRTPTRTLGLVIRQALAKGLVGETQSRERAQVEIDKFFATDRLLHVVDPCNILQVKMVNDLIFLDIDGGSIDPKDRLPEDWKGKIDPLTTPQGKRILQTYQMCRGAFVDENDRLQQGQSLFSAGMEACLLFPEDTRPHRLLTARSALEHREVLVRAEQPWVAHHKYENWMLFGCHLMTAVVDHPLGYEDCILVSESGAKKLACYRFKTYSMIDAGAMVVAGRGEKVAAGSPLITSKDRIVKAGWPMEVFESSMDKTVVAGKGGYRARVIVFTIYDLEDGDKLSTRHGNKGCVRILPDFKFPRIFGEDRRAQVMIHPKSVLTRRCYGTIREMALNAKSMGDEIRVKHFSGDDSLSSLALQGYVKARTTQGNIFVGPLYWLRVDKHAREMCSATGEKPVDFRGLSPDSSRAGQRLGTDMQTVLKAKGLEQGTRHLLKSNFEPEARKQVDDLIRVLI